MISSGCHDLQSGLLVRFVERIFYKLWSLKTCFKWIFEKLEKMNKFLFSIYSCVTCASVSASTALICSMRSKLIINTTDKTWICVAFMPLLPTLKTSHKSSGFFNSYKTYLKPFHTNPFMYPLKTKPEVFLMFSGDIERNQWHKIIGIYH